MDMTSRNRLDDARRRRLLMAWAAAHASALAACGGATTAPTANPPEPEPTPAPPPAPSPPPVTDGLGGSPIELPAAYTGPLPPWLASLPLWRWSAVPGTALSSVDPNPRPAGITGPRSKIDAWCGAGLKRSGSVYLIAAAGGHADYAGNEVDALALNTDRPAWSQLRPPSAPEDVIDQAQFYLDKRPAAAHTYYATQFIDALDRLMVIGSPGLNNSAVPKPPAQYPYMGKARSFSFDMARGDWDDPDFVASYPGSGDHHGCLCARHPWSGDIYYSRNYRDGWYRWTRSANRWDKLAGVTRSPWYAGTAVDPRRNRMLIAGGYSPALAEMRLLSGAPAGIAFSGPAAGMLHAVVNYPGVVYDEALDCYFVVHNSGGQIRMLRVNAETAYVDEAPIEGSLPPSRANGMHNAAQYVPELRGIVLAYRHDADVLFLRTSA
jgi:hypothetical protein